MPGIVPGIVNQAFARPDCSGLQGIALRPRVLLTAASLHLAAIGAAWLLASARHATEPPPEITPEITVVFKPPAPQPAELPMQTIPPSSLPAPAETVPDVLASPSPLVLPAYRPRVLPDRNARRRAPDRAAEPAMQEAEPPGTAPAQAAAPAHALAGPSADVQHALANWDARVRQAVQDAAIYPSAARLLRREGRAQVRFDYAGGAVALASVVQTSHFAPLDAAALAAVTRASIPTPPPEVGAQKRTMLVWVQFSLVATE